MSSFLDDVNNPRWQQASAMSQIAEGVGLQARLLLNAMCFV